jgi:hypothetical protein
METYIWTLKMWRQISTRKEVSVLFPSVTESWILQCSLLYYYYYYYYCYYSFIHMCIHCSDHFSLLSPPRQCPLLPLPSRQKLFCAFLQFLSRVEIIATPGDSSWWKETSLLKVGPEGNRDKTLLKFLSQEVLWEKKD